MIAHMQLEPDSAAGDGSCQGYLSVSYVSECLAAQRVDAPGDVGLDRPCRGSFVKLPASSGTLR